LFDIDNFKTINDKYGHNVGDMILKKIGTVLRCCTRDVDIPARCGGDEIAVIVPNSTLEEAAAAAERITGLIRKEPVTVTSKANKKVSIPYSVSVGVASLKETMKTPEDLIHAADIRMYTAKQEGRDRIIYTS
jgi:diguanylate cyclase (GGDEF)-like protein